LGYSGRPRGHGRPDGDRYRRIAATGRAVGALMAISREAIEAVGLLDEDLFAYVEDVDWALRVREAGYQVVLAPRAHAWHRVSASTGGARSTHTLYYGVRNTIAVLERHRPLGRAGNGLRRVAIAATYVLHALGRPDRRAALSAVVSGYRDARAGRLGPRPLHR
jgi:GT2 family glycosyltransferase